MKPDLSTLGKRLKHARELRGFRSQKALAKAAELSQGTIGNLESGSRFQPRELLRLASVLRVSPAWLQTGAAPMDAAVPPLRGDVLDFALELQQKTPDQVAKLRAAVTALGPDASEDEPQS